jgi:hypothetical protein
MNYKNVHINCSEIDMRRKLIKLSHALSIDAAAPIEFEVEGDKDSSQTLNNRDGE